MRISVSTSFMPAIALTTLALLLSLTLSGCASSKTKKAPNGEVEYYQAAMRSLKANNYQTAILKLNELEARYPVSIYTEQAQLEMIYAQYRSMDLPGAIAASDRFLRLHPDHAQVDYVLYMKGLASYYQDQSMLERLMPDRANRDLTTMREAFNSFNQLVRQFPASTYAADARQRMIYIRQLMAEQEIITARYYLMRDACVAAINRSKTVLENYTSTPSVADALGVLSYCQQRLGNTALAHDNLALLKQNFPDYRWLKHGQIIYPDGPHNEQRSWLNIISFGLMGDDGLHHELPMPAPAPVPVTAQ